MAERCVLILLDSKANRHSLNALVGALETDRDLDEVELRLPANESRLALAVDETLAAGKRAVVGVSFATLQVGRVRDIVARRAGGPQTLWIAGGPHPTADPEGTLRLGFDAVVRGEGEVALRKLLHDLLAGRERGIDFTPVDLDAFPPFPLWRRRVVGPIEITRGCPFACGYCQTTALHGPRPRHRGIEMIARYAAVIRQRGLRDVRLVTPNAFSYGSPDGRTLNLAAVESLLAALRQTLGAEGRFYFGSFPSEVRPEHVNPATVALVKRYADNDNLVIGAQSGCDRLLRHCGRGHTVADVFSAVSATLAGGLTAHVDFIFGLPGESDGELRETCEVIRELVALGAKIHAHVFMPLPQTRFAAEPAGRIHGRVRPFIRELIRRGQLHGVWHKHEREAQRLADHLRGECGAFS